MAEKLPSLVLTGASGFVGRNFLETARNRFRIFAIARRSQHKAGVEHHPNVSWIQVDIGNRKALRRVARHIREEGGADFLLHLAAYYDFENEELPAFEHTNVEGTRNVLDMAELLGVEHFVFASSVAACEFPRHGESITEETQPDATFPYARSKKVGEEMVRQRSESFRCSIVRLAAVYSDWCEYAPLYMFLSTWLSRQWNSRVLGGKGASAIPYIHTRDVTRLFFTLFERGEDLPACGVYNASPDGATSHQQLYDLTTRFHFGREVRAVHMPKILAYPGVVLLDLLGRVLGKRPFERPWMMEYLDLSLSVDATQTRELLGWAPTPRFHILRRILFLMEKMKSDPQVWHVRNEMALKRPPARPGLVIHDAMMEAKEAIVDAIAAYVHSPVRHDRFPSYGQMSYDDLRWNLGIVYELLMAAVRTGDRTLLLNYIFDLARKRFAAGFPPAEVCEALLAIGEVTIEELLYKPEVAELKGAVRDSVGLSLALAIDGVQDAYDEYEQSKSVGMVWVPTLSETDSDLEQIVEKLNAFYRPTAENGMDRRREPEGS